MLVCNDEEGQLGRAQEEHLDFSYNGDVYADRQCIDPQPLLSPPAAFISVIIVTASTTPSASSSLPLQHQEPHSKKKSTSEHLFWCFRLSQIENSIQYKEVPNGIWKDHDRHIGVPLAQSEAPKKVL